MAKAKISTHTKSHPDQVLLEAGNGWGGGEYLTAGEAKRLARRLDVLASELRRRELARLMDDKGVIV